MGCLVPRRSTAGRDRPTSAELITCVAEASAIAERGRNRVVENWSWKRTAERTVTHYRALLAEAAAERTGTPAADRSGGRPDPVGA